MNRDSQRAFVEARAEYLRTWDALDARRRGASVIETYRLDRQMETLTREFQSRYPRSAR